jgi:hypothetical protein
MPGIPREVTELALKIKPGSKPVKQCLHCFDEEKHRAISEEIAKLLVAGFIKEVYLICTVRLHGRVGHLHGA